MGQTNIEWTDYTWNPWSGCNKISQGCRFCYAAALPPSMRRRAVWGADAPRIEALEEYWRQPIVWDRKAAKEGVRRKVFCASTADIGEARPELDAWRDRALALVALTPNLDWLWLTKRPEYLAEYFAAPGLYRRVLDAAEPFRWSKPRSNGLSTGNDRLKICITDPTRGLPRNLWVGTSVEDQAAADARIPHLLRIPARVRFLSMEPLLGAVNLSRIPCQWSGCRGKVDALDGECSVCIGLFDSINWVIVGGESGRNARPMHPDWARSIRDQCVSAGVPYFFKQWGEWAPGEAVENNGTDWLQMYEADDDGGAPVHDWADSEYRARVPDLADRRPGEVGGDTRVLWVTKKLAGRLLDGREWNEVPQ